jgi:Protein of unknown function (DUF3667)
MTITSLLHEVAHIFTHFEKGFFYSFKQLATRPGQMQKDFLAGDRSRHQKPFSMFFVCATLAALAIYLSSKRSSGMTHLGEVTEEFSRHYYVILQSILLPFYALIAWLLFRSKDFNYAEALVLTVYTLAFVLLLIIPVNMINFLPHHMETTFLEVPVMAGYFTWTNLRFFNTQPAWLVIIKSILLLLAGFIVLQFIANQVILWMM